MKKITSLVLVAAASVFSFNSVFAQEVPDGNVGGLAKLAKVLYTNVLSEGGTQLYAGAAIDAVDGGTASPEITSLVIDKIALFGRDMGTVGTKVASNTRHVNAESKQGLTDFLVGMDPDKAAFLIATIDTSKTDMSVAGTITNNGERGYNTEDRRNNNVASFGNLLVGLPKGKYDAAISAIVDTGSLDNNTTLNAADKASKKGWAAGDHSWGVNSAAFTDVKQNSHKHIK